MSSNNNSKSNDNNCNTILSALPILTHLISYSSYFKEGIIITPFKDDETKALRA